MGRHRRPFIFVLAGVNGAGKSSVGGNVLVENNLAWFNPDSYARELVAQRSMSIDEANSIAWQFGCTQLEGAVARCANHAFETTLGGSSITNLLIEASATHDVSIWYWGLDSVELHVQRVKARVCAGGHDIPEGKIRERWKNSRQNLIRLLPYLNELHVFDNSAEASPGTLILPPQSVLKVKKGKILSPDLADPTQLAAVPEWAHPIVEAAIELQRGS